MPSYLDGKFAALYQLPSGDSYLSTRPQPLSFLDPDSLRNPLHPALIHRDLRNGSRRVVTYGELERRVTQCQRWLEQQGLKEGEAVAYAMENRPEALMINFAVALHGALAVPLDFHRDSTERKAFKLRDAGVKILILANDYPDGDAAAKELEELRRECPETRLFQLTKGCHLNLPHFLSGVDEPDEAVSSKLKRLDKPCLVLYTSGTTGKPKGVVHTLASLGANTANLQEWLGLTTEDIFHLVLPLHHINSTVFAFALLQAQGTVVISSRYSASQFWNILSQEKATLSSIVPTILEDLNGTFDKLGGQPFPDLRSCSRILIGSAPISPKAVTRFRELYGIPLFQGYGTTETSFRVAGQPLNLSEKDYYWAVKKNSCGVALKYAHVSVWDDGAKAEAPDKTLGEIVVRGPVLMHSYLNQPEATRDAFANGWFHTGDLGYTITRRGQRFFFIQGRIKEIIIKGGVNISPAAVEEALKQHIHGVANLTIVGVPDERMGEELCAIVTFWDHWPPTQRRSQIVQLLQAGLAGRIPGLSVYEAPKFALEMEKGDLPQTTTLKILRAEIKNMVGEYFRTGKFPPEWIEWKAGGKV